MKFLTIALFLFSSFFISLTSRAQTSLTVDVCVYGGTSAGVIAAYTAKKAGKSVVLIEPGRHLGGLTSGGLGATDIGNKFAITGLSRDFYRRIGKQYGRFEQWTFEPHVAENTFNQYITAAKILVWKNYRILSTRKKGMAIEAIEVELSTSPDPKTNRTVKAKQFIDCSYEGDLMARAGVSYAVGREANTQYNETYNGVQLMDKHQFLDGIDPYRMPGKPESGLIWGISQEKLSANGSGDRKIQAYNYRLCLTNVPENRIDISRPERYDSTMYELLLRQIASHEPKELTWNLMHFVPMPNHKTDINNCGGLSTDMIGANWDYPDASYDRRAQIIQEHEDYTKGLLYFIGNDLRMPKHLRDEMRQWGYPKDEYTDNGNFSHQLYIREARRMLGEYVMTQANCEGKIKVTDGIGMAAYTMDSHNCQRLVVEKSGLMMVKNEGDVQVGGFPPYPVSYRSLVPKRSEVTNLLVPVCLSASHIAYGSIRMEPVFMVLAQSAAVAAVLAINDRKAVQDIDVAKLQAILKTNPQMDGSHPEVLVDNDDSTRVVLKGDWLRETKGGKYGYSMLVANSTKPASAIFQAPGAAPGLYEICVYNPNRTGGGGNPDNPGKQTDKASRVQVRMMNGRTVKEHWLNQQEQSGDWISLGRLLIEKGKPPYVELISDGNDGFVVADAVLFLPVR